MNILRAEAYLSRLSTSPETLAELYDDDEMLREALATLFPDFEYPDFSHLTLAQIEAKYRKKQRPLLSPS